ncbi:MAG: hypothetical protein AAF281_04150 [Pseudomonadota bacterium]
MVNPALGSVERVAETILLSPVNPLVLRLTLFAAGRFQPRTEAGEMLPPAPA